MTNDINNIPEFFECIINPDMMARSVNDSLRESIVGIIITSTAAIRKINMTEYEHLINEAKRFANAYKIIILKDDKCYKEICFGRHNDMSTMKALKELLNFVTSTEAHYDGHYDTIISGIPHIGFYYETNFGKISIVCKNEDYPIEF